MNEQIEKYFLGELTTGQKDELFRQMAEKPDIRDEFSRVQNSWALAVSSGVPGDKYLAGLYLREFRKRLNRKKALTLFTGLSKYAAILVVGILIAKGLFHKTQPVETSAATYHTLTVPAGQRAHLTLADGTLVWLNARSTLEYPEAFTENTRELTLAGEAYFEVAKHPEKPFIVKTGELKIEALGTRFNVRALEDESYIRTTLIEGSVKIQKNDPTKGNDVIILAPGRQLQFDRQSGKMSLRDVNSQLYTAWKDGQIIFDQEQMDEVFALIEQNFGMTVVLKNEQLTGRRFTGRFGLDEKPEKILALIQQSIPFGFVVQNDTIFIRP